MTKKPTLTEKEIFELAEKVSAHLKTPEGQEGLKNAFARAEKENKRRVKASEAFRYWLANGGKDIPMI